VRRIDRAPRQEPLAELLGLVGLLVETRREERDLAACPGGIDGLVGDREAALASRADDRVAIGELLALHEVVGGQILVHRWSPRPVEASGPATGTDRDRNRDGRSDASRQRIASLACPGRRVHRDWGCRHGPGTPREGGPFSGVPGIIQE
jgi:hypothetical protein